MHESPSTRKRHAPDTSSAASPLCETTPERNPNPPPTTPHAPPSVSVSQQLLAEDASPLPPRVEDDNQTLISVRLSTSDQLSLCETLVASEHGSEKSQDSKMEDHDDTPGIVLPLLLTSPPEPSTAVIFPPADVDAADALRSPASARTTERAPLAAAPHLQREKRHHPSPLALVRAEVARIVRTLVLIVQALMRIYNQWYTTIPSVSTLRMPRPAMTPSGQQLSQDRHGHKEDLNQDSVSPPSDTGDARPSSPPSRLLSDPHGGNSALPMRARRPSPPEHAQSKPVKAQVVDSSPKTLVLDLDETLIHSVARSANREGPQSSFGLNSALGMPRRMFSSGLATLGLGPNQASGLSSLAGTTSVEVVLGGRSVVYTVHKRPGVDAFLAQVAEWYSVVVFTASVREYADPVIDWLDAGRGLFQGRLFRESCIYKNGAYIKDLAAVVRKTPMGPGTEEDQLRCICLLDNSPASWRLHPANGIPIEGWTHDPYDTALMDLLPVLDSLRFCDDVRHVLGIRLLALDNLPASSRPASTVSSRRPSDSEKSATSSCIAVH